MLRSGKQIVNALVQYLADGGWILTKTDALFQTFKRERPGDSEQRLIFNYSFPRDQLPGPIYIGIVVNFDVFYPKIEKKIAELTGDPISNITFASSAAQFLGGDDAFAGSVLLFETNSTTSMASDRLKRLIDPQLKYADRTLDSHFLDVMDVATTSPNQYYWSIRRIAYALLLADFRSLSVLVGESRRLLEERPDNFIGSRDVPLLDLNRSRSDMTSLRKAIDKVQELINHQESGSGLASRPSHD